jgi:hypothetical protein
MTMLETYFNFVQERHKIWERRQAGMTQPPWTEDPILARLKFTNMFRVLDPGSQFVLTDLYDENMVDSDFLVRCFMYRITNLPETWVEMREEFGRYPTASDLLNYPGALTRILKKRRDAKKQIFSGAYVIIPEPNTKNDKIEGVVKLTRMFVQQGLDDFLVARSQEERFNVLRSIPGIGKFLAMQILTDWGYGQGVYREGQFIVAGPGSTRGAKHVDPHHKAEDVIFSLRGTLLRRGPRLGDYPLSLMDVQNTLCEFSKYVRESEKPRKVTPYTPAHPGPQPKPVLPGWMR